MSSSSPNRLIGIALGFTAIGLGPKFAAVHAAEFYVQPEADVLFDVDSNRGLATKGAVTSEGYSGQAGATLGYATPISDTTARLRAGYQDYPKLSDHEFQGTAEFKSDFNWQRSEFNAYGKVDRLNTFSSELATATFDPLIPVNPTTPETGRLNTDTTRTLGDLVPHYSYRISPRLSVGAAGIFESAVYSGPAASAYVSYNYLQGSAFVNYSLTQRADLSVGPYVSRDVDRNGAGSTDGYGGNVALTYKWSQTFSGRLDLSEERDDTVGPEPASQKFKSNAFGASYTTSWTGQISSLQLMIGRQLTPSGSGGEYIADQLQVEYDRKFSARLSADLAARLIRYTASVDQIINAPYKYVDSTLGLKWLLTRTWYVNSGLQFTRIDFGSATSQSAGGGANNFRFYLGFGYLGLGKRG